LRGAEAVVDMGSTSTHPLESSTLECLVDAEARAVAGTGGEAASSEVSPVEVVAARAPEKATVGVAGRAAARAAAWAVARVPELAS